MNEKESYFGADGPAGRAARAAEETAGSLPEVEARLEGVTVGQMMLYGIRGAYLYHRALAEQERGGGNMGEAKRTNYDLLYGSQERAAVQLTVEIQAAMIQALPNPLVGATSDEREMSKRIEAMTRWQGTLMASTFHSIKEWAVEFLAAAPGEFPDMVHEHASGPRNAPEAA